MKKSILALAACALLAYSTPVQAQKSEGESLLRAALKGWHVKLRAGFLLGGTTPLPLPQEIRAIDSYNPTMNVGIEGDVQKRFDNSRWGMALGVRLETKGMKTDATVKNYHMEMTADDGGYMVGAWTGHVTTRVRATYLTFPILAVYEISPRWELRGGPYLSWMYDGDFTGEAYDGYIRHGNPTGEKAEVTRASYDFSKDLRRFQWGVQVGAEWAAYKHLSVYADLTWGINSIFPHDFESVTFAMYPVYANVGFSYLF